MRTVSTSTNFVAALCLSIAPAYAAGSHGQPTVVTHGASTTHGSTTPGPKTTASSGATTHGPSHGTSSQKSTHTKTTSTKPTTKTSPKTDTKTTTGATGDGNASTTTSSTSTTGGSTTTSAIAEKIAKNPELESRLAVLLPKDMTMADAAKGFKNQGQFIAALHVSQNLGVSFTQLKTEMVDHNRSLGQSIQVVKKGANASTETSRAEKQTTRDLVSTDPSIPHEEEEDPWPKAKQARTAKSSKTSTSTKSAASDRQ